MTHTIMALDSFSF